MNLKNGENTVGMIRDIMQKYGKASALFFKFSKPRRSASFSHSGE